MSQHQQGDVLIEKINCIPIDAVAVQGRIIMHGEGTHQHQFAATANVRVYEKDGVKFARVLSDIATVEHVTPSGERGEHFPVYLEAGDYQISQVQEYDYLAEMARDVVD